jgi:hypothetical protein
MPHALDVVPDWQTPLASQQPDGQLAAEQGCTHEVMARPNKEIKKNARI